MTHSCAYPKCNLPATKESFIRGEDGSVIAVVPTCHPHSEMVRLGLTNDRLVGAVQEALGRIFKEKERLEHELKEVKERETRFEKLLNEWLNVETSSPEQAQSKWVVDFRSRVEDALLSVGHGDIIDDSEIYDGGFHEDS